MARKAEVYYTPYILDDWGEATDQIADYKRLGLFEYWGQTSNIEYVDGIGNLLRPMIVGVVSDAETGRVYLVSPTQIIFKRDNRNVESNSAGAPLSDNKG